jgi:hypothetical protein
MNSAYLLYCLLLVVEMALAFVCGPYSCEWGNQVYFFAGLAGLLLSFLCPFVQTGWSQQKRTGTGVLFLFGSVLWWCAGFVVADFRLMCRLF